MARYATLASVLALLLAAGSSAKGAESLHWQGGHGRSQTILAQLHHSIRLGCVYSAHQCSHLAHSNGYHHHHVVHSHECGHPHLLCMAEEDD